MTAGELKFALQVEAIMILCLIVEHDGGKCHWNEMIVVDKLVRHANEVFIKEQVGLLVCFLVLCPAWSRGVSKLVSVYVSDKFMKRRNQDSPGWSS